MTVEYRIESGLLDGYFSHDEALYNDTQAKKTCALELQAGAVKLRWPTMGVRLMVRYGQHQVYRYVLQPYCLTRVRRRPPPTAPPHPLSLGRSGPKALVIIL